MADDWSLRGKLLLIEGFYHYLDDDIETLCKKLKDDINGKIGEVVFKDDVINIINKRFGVDAIPENSRVKPDPRLTESMPIR